MRCGEPMCLRRTVRGTTRLRNLSLELISSSTTQRIDNTIYIQLRARMMSMAAVPNAIPEIKAKALSMENGSVKPEPR